MKQETYYVQYFAKKCLGTGQSIPFKTVDQYLAQDFIDKNAIKAFIKKEPSKAREWAISWLKKRKEEKGLVYAPSQVELRSLQCPSQPYFDSVGGYYKITKELGFKDRYTNESLVFNALPGDCSVIVDNREQKPLKFAIKTTKGTIHEGDYALAAPHDKGIYVERKSLNDMVSTLNRRINEREKKKGGVTVDTSFDRFDRELARAAEKGNYIVMVVENSISDALSFNYLPQLRWSRVSPSHVMKNLRELLTKYPLSFQAVFTDGRDEAARVTMRIFEMGEQVRRVDLQNALERKLL
jgi:hypothetical protein